MNEEAQGHHSGPHLRSYMLYQYYHQHVTQPLLREQLHAFGVDISSGQLARLLTKGHAAFHAETEALLRAGLEVSSYLNVDDTSARHQGKNGYCLYLGSQYFAWYRSALAKDRLSFITVARGSARQRRTIGSMPWPWSIYAPAGRASGSSIASLTRQ
jgi:hypothetical protein